MIINNVLSSLVPEGIEDASLDMFYVPTCGLYLFVEPAPESGGIVHVRAFGYLSEENLELSFVQPDILRIPHLFVVVFRHEAGSYRLTHRPVLLTHIRAPGVLPEQNGVLNITVQRGDRIGAIIPNSCTNITEHRGDKISAILPNSCTNLSCNALLCPSQINLRTGRRSQCSTALYHYYDTDKMEDFEDLESIPEDQFEEVSLELNLEVLISPNPISPNGMW